MLNTIASPREIWHLKTGDLITETKGDSKCQEKLVAVGLILWLLNCCLWSAAGRGVICSSFSREDNSRTSSEDARVLLFPVLSENNNVRLCMFLTDRLTCYHWHSHTQTLLIKLGGLNTFLDLTPRFPARPNITQRAASQPAFFSQRNSSAEHVQAEIVQLPKSPS